MLTQNKSIIKTYWIEDNGVAIPLCWNKGSCTPLKPLALPLCIKCIFRIF